MSAPFLCLGLFYFGSAHSISQQDSNAANTDWLNVAAWIDSNGGYVEPTIKSNMTSHSGLSIRGIVSGKALRPGKPVLFIPKKLWLTLDKFPDLQQSPLEHLQQCGAPLQKHHLNMVKMAGALARETRKGNASFYHVYISGLPTMDDFRSFHPRFMRDDVQEDFGGLAMTADATELKKFDVKLKDCFQSWTKVPNSPVAGITSDDMELALMQYRTRTFDSGKYPSMVPGADFLNTDKPVLVNTIWQVKDDNFKVDMIRGGVGPGTELFYMYCKTCDNDKLVGIWGLYLEGNENPVQTAADCAAQVATLRHGKFKSLRQASEAMLNLSDVPAASGSGKRVPRCRKEALSSEQGPLRCSLARLAWEHCAAEWGYPSAGTQEYALFVESKLRAPAMADLISQSYAHAFLSTPVQRHF